MKQYEIDQLDLSCSRLQTEVNSIIDVTNIAITESYNTIMNSADKINRIKDKVAVLGDMLTDLKIINGTTGLNTNFTDLDIYSTQGVIIDDDVITLDKTKETIVEFDNRSSILFSTKPLSLLSTSGKEKTIEEVLKYRDLTKLSVNSINISVNFTLKYSRISKINQIVIHLPINTTVYPSISELKYLSSTTNNYMPINFQDTTSNIIDIDEERKIGNVYTFDIDPIDTKEITFTLNTKESSYIDILGIETKHVERALSGEIILGPVVTDDPILKVGVSSEYSTDNVEIEISHNLLNWFPMTDTDRINLDNNRKILAYNTVNQDSFKTESDVNTMYIKLKLNSEILDNDTISPYEGYREDGSITIDLKQLDSTRVSALRIERDDFYYGDNTYSNVADITLKMKKDLEKLSVGGNLLVRGFDETPYSYGIKPIAISGVEVKLRHKRLHAEIGIDASTFDSVGGLLLDIVVVPITGDINVNSGTDICFPLKLKEDTYRLVSQNTKRYIEYDISSSFLNTAQSTIIQVPYEDINLSDSLGNIIEVFNKEDLYSIVEGEVTYYFISLAKTLYQITEVTGYEFNPMYPLVALESKEYSLEDNKLVLGSNNIVTISGFKLNKINIEKKLVVSYQNGNIWERTNPLYTYHHTQLDRDNIEKTVIKLDHRSIEKGTLALYEYDNYSSVDSKLTLLTVTNRGVTPTEYLTEETSSNVFIGE